MRKAYKIVFLGNTSVGKTTLISQYLYNKVQVPTATIGIDFLSNTFEINGRQVRLQLWDTAGQERFHSIIGNYTRDTFLAIIVFAIDNVDSLKQVKSWINQFVLSHNDRKSVRILVVANKMDEPVDNLDEVLSEAKAICSSLDAELVKTKALDSQGIKEMVDAINQYIIDDLEKNENNEDETEELNAIKAVPRGGRCC